MTGPSVLTATSRRGALRLVVLALTLVGFAALHAFGSIAGDGAHCGSAPAVMMVAESHNVTESHNTAWSSLPDHHAATSATHDESAPAAARTPGHSSDDVTTGCLLALLGALVLIGLRRLRRFGIDTTSPRVPNAFAWLRAARAPPGPLFLSLCVFRL